MQRKYKISLQVIFVITVIISSFFLGVHVTSKIMIGMNQMKMEAGISNSKIQLELIEEGKIEVLREMIASNAYCDISFILSNISRPHYNKDSPTFLKFKAEILPYIKNNDKVRCQDLSEKGLKDEL